MRRAAGDATSLIATAIADLEVFAMVSPEIKLILQAYPDSMMSCSVSMVSSPVSMVSSM